MQTRTDTTFFRWLSFGSQLSWYQNSSFGTSDAYTNIYELVNYPFTQNESLLIYIYVILCKMIFILLIAYKISEVCGIKIVWYFINILTNMKGSIHTLSFRFLSFWIRFLLWLGVYHYRVGWIHRFLPCLCQQSQGNLRFCTYSNMKNMRRHQAPIWSDISIFKFNHPSFHSHIPLCLLTAKQMAFEFLM